MGAGNEVLINVLIAIAGMVLTVVMAVMAGLLGVVIKIWMTQTSHATRLALLEDGQTKGATILKQELVQLLMQIEARIEAKMVRMERRLTSLLAHQPTIPPELPPDEPDPLGAGG